VKGYVPLRYEADFLDGFLPISMPMTATGLLIV
jgi:hypothetical protein